MDKKELEEILRNLNIIEKQLQKTVYKKEQTECDSECSEIITNIVKKIKILDAISSELI